MSAVFHPFPPVQGLLSLLLENSPWHLGHAYQRFLTLLKNVRVLYHHNQRARARPTGARTCRRPPHVCDRTVVAGRRRRRGVDEANLSRPRSPAKPPAPESIGITAVVEATLRATLAQPGLSRSRLEAQASTPHPRASPSRRRRSSAAMRRSSILARCSLVSARHRAFSPGSTTPGSRRRYQGCAGAPGPARSKPSASRRAMTLGCLRYEKNAARPFEPRDGHADGAQLEPVGRRNGLKFEEATSLSRPELLRRRRHEVCVARARCP